MSLKLPVLATSMDDATATALGRKHYQHGTNYNGGIAPTLTGMTHVYSSFIPYQMQDGSWRLKNQLGLINK